MPWSSSVRRWVRGFGVSDFVHPAVKLLDEREQNVILHNPDLFNEQTNPEGVQ
jgi:hypothetical protein